MNPTASYYCIGGSRHGQRVQMRERRSLYRCHVREEPPRYDGDVFEHMPPETIEAYELREIRWGGPETGRSYLILTTLSSAEALKLVDDFEAR